MFSASVLVTILFAHIFISLFFLCVKIHKQLAWDTFICHTPTHTLLRKLRYSIFVFGGFEKHLKYGMQLFFEKNRILSRQNVNYNWYYYRLEWIANKQRDEEQMYSSTFSNLLCCFLQTVCALSLDGALRGDLVHK